MTYYIFQVISRVLVAFALLPVHEFAHAWAAYKLGDNTANYSGRLTLNPFAHIDPVGTLLLVLTGYGWAKPVPVNPRNFKNSKIGMGLTALAGPVSNILMSFVLLLVCKGITLIPVYDMQVANVLTIIISILSFMAQTSVILAVFNLIPVPPLDGSRVLGLILPDRIYFKIMQYERYIYIALMVLVFTGVLSTPISIVGDALYSLLLTLSGLGG